MTNAAMKSWIFARHGGQTEHGDRLRHVHRDALLDARNRRRHRHRGEFGVVRQVAENVVEQLAELLRRDVSDGNDLEVAARESALAERLQVRARDRADAALPCPATGAHRHGPAKAVANQSLAATLSGLRSA